MKIAFLTPEYPHSRTGSSGGIGTSIKNLAVGLLAQGVSVRILVYGQKEDAIFDDNGILVQQVKNVKFKGLSWFFTRKKLERIINELHSNNKIDVVEAPDWTGITSFIKPQKCPIIIRLNGSDTYFCHLDDRPVKWKNKFHEKKALQNADGLLSVSQFTADKTNAVFNLHKKFAIIPNPIDSKLFQNRNSNNNTGQNILYFGSLIRKKGLLELPLIFNKVIEKNPEAQLILVGRDVPDIMSGKSSTWEMMQPLFSDSALKNVEYLGSVPYEEVKQVIEKSKICVFPSFAEAFPVSWLEAMAMEKPIIASNIGWANEMIEEGKNGFLVNPKDHNLYSQRIIEFLNNEKLCLEAGKSARKKVEECFDIEVLAKKNIEFYKSLIS
ncbi:glycosyltransferase family 4 protein [Flavobacterium defluvii]|uniref:Glycosyltransferase involved in cell wall bisynthesis n=1 Tax=Flavobacterium defluvii TaxID=370979 RepID=A0A1M5NSP7_9FLAO|nr:glycosyltransferase family 4 protein [Flavobacterium defluvii]SHG92576.1 Glycosyltransferase involved in cell wall bisynthesis [Flavobacterium defluvii]